MSARSITLYFATHDGIPQDCTVSPSLGLCLAAALNPDDTEERPSVTLSTLFDWLDEARIRVYRTTFEADPESATEVEF